MDKKHFGLPDQGLASEPYHYRACGLDNVYLLNGFTYEQTDYGPAVSIHNVDDLHRTIGLQLVTDRKPLNGRELRFLRKEMNSSQDELARRLKVDVQTVARYEKGQTAIPGSVDAIVRILYAIDLLPEDRKLEVVEDVIDDLDEDAGSAGGDLYFSQTDDHWSIGGH